MGEFIKKVSKVLGFEVEEDTDEKMPENFKERNEYIPGPRKNNVVSIHTVNNSKVVILRPKNYETVQEIADYLKSNIAVVVDLDEVDKALAMRIFDFLSGTTYTIKGSIQKINANIFLITPSNFQVIDPSGKEKSSLHDLLKEKMPGRF